SDRAAPTPLLGRQLGAILRQAFRPWDRLSSLRLRVRAVSTLSAPQEWPDIGDLAAGGSAARAASAEGSSASHPSRFALDYGPAPGWRTWPEARSHRRVDRGPARSARSGPLRRA